jgi:hypothetical protein
MTDRRIKMSSQACGGVSERAVEAPLGIGSLGTEFRVLVVAHGYLLRIHQQNLNACSRCSAAVGLRVPSTWKHPLACWRAGLSFRTTAKTPSRCGQPRSFVPDTWPVRGGRGANRPRGLSVTVRGHRGVGSRPRGVREG